MLKNLENKILSLPPELQQNVNDFKDKKNFNLKWAGALRDYKKEFTSLELQKKALEWRD